ncbi:MAG: diguanylate cyclase [Clostridia bacterium]
MKKLILRNLTIFIFLIMIFLLMFNYYLQLTEAELSQENSALSTISQIQEILTTNDADLDTLTESLKEEYIIKAKAVAYILENIDIETIEEYQELADMLDIDEIHVFNEDGEIYEGSVENYFGYTFDSGEQMSFFLPMLDDKTLTLCQDVTPNTAEEKSMMYVATWKNDGSDIVQIGIAPERILEEQSKNEISYIFSTMPTSDGSTLFAIDSETGLILGCSDEELSAQDSVSLGLSLNETNTDGTHFYTEVDGVEQLCVFLNYDGTYIGITYEKSIIINEVLNSILTLSLYFVAFCIILIIVLFKIIDFSILKNIDLLILKVSKIAGGDLDTTFDIGITPEFKKLNSHLNMMVASLLNSTEKISRVLDFVDTKIAVYEYKNDMKRVFATNKISELICVSNAGLPKYLSDKEIFEEKIKAIKKNTTDFDDVYMNNDNKYLQIEGSVTSDGEYGIILDVTDNINERMLIEYERDYDVLTDLYNRRAFFRSMDKLFEDENKLKQAVIVALDMDNLKEINDTHGHDMGDLAIKISADIIKNYDIPNKITSRMGGDEYCIVIYGEDDKQTLINHINQIEQAYKNATITLDNKESSVKMSAGYVFCSDSQIDYQRLLKFADTALYKAKNTGKNKFVEYVD